MERRRKNLFRHLGLEGLGIGEEHLLRLTLSEEGEGGGAGGGYSRGVAPSMRHLVAPSSSWAAPPQEEVRCRRKDLAKFLGVEEVPTMERVKGRSLDSSSSDCYSIPSYSGICICFCICIRICIYLCICIVLLLHPLLLRHQQLHL